MTEKCEHLKTFVFCPFCGKRLGKFVKKGKERKVDEDDAHGFKRMSKAIDEIGDMLV